MYCSGGLNTLVPDSIAGSVRRTEPEHSGHPVTNRQN